MFKYRCRQQENKMIGFAEITFVVLIGLGVLFGLGVGLIKTWDKVVAIRRRHRLEREEDERNHSKQLAADYAEALQQINNTGGTMDFADYRTKPKLSAIREKR